MCIPASMIVTPSRVYWNPPELGESHTDIRKHHKLRDDMHETVGVAIEITPPNGDFSAPAKDWEFRVDQDILPDWWNPRDGRESACAEVPHWLAAHTVASDAEIEITSGFWLVLRGAPVITQSGGDIYTHHSSAPVITQSGGDIGTWDSSAPVIAQSGGDIRTYDSSAPVVTRVTG